MRAKHKSLNKDEKRPVRALEAEGHKVILGPFQNCRHSKTPGRVESLGGGVYRIYSGDGVREVTVKKPTRGIRET